MNYICDRFIQLCTLMEQSINISQLGALASIANEYCRLDNEYLLARIKGDADCRTMSQAPMRIDGLVFFLCLKGSVTLSINLESRCITDHSILGIGPDKIISFDKMDAGEVDFYIFFLSRHFVSDLNIDMKVLDAIPAFDIDPDPLIHLNDNEISMLESSLKLLHTNTVTSDPIYRKSIAHALTAAICYQMMQFHHRRSDREPERDRPRSRRAAYVHQFRQLIHKHHRQERSVSFYADKMFISPKYLSLVIKETTGRTAAEWIDDYVILEAKNMLRFSDKNVQQIAYELNFPNQSSFGKYFKHLTGMSPTAYQRS